MSIVAPSIPLSRASLEPNVTARQRSMSEERGASLASIVSVNGGSTPSHQETASASAIHPDGIASNASNPPTQPISMLIWLAIAGVTVREEKHGLQEIAPDVRCVSDTESFAAVDTTSGELEPLLRSERFQHITTLHIHDPDAASLALLCAHLKAHPRPSLTLQLFPKSEVSPEAAIRLSDLTLRELRLDYGVDGIDGRVLAGLTQSKSPICLRGYFAPDTFIGASKIALLTSLEVIGKNFDNSSAQLFDRHPALEVLSVDANWGLSAGAFEVIAALPMLRELRVTEWCVPVVNDRVAKALAGNPRFETLDIHGISPCMSESSFSALCESASLKTLRIPIFEKLHDLRNLQSLENLEFYSESSNGRRLLTREMASTLINLPHLTSLSLPPLHYDAGALPLILSKTRVSHLVFQGYRCFTEQDCDALMSNANLRKLTMADGNLSSINIPVLIKHPTLETLQVGELVFTRKPGDKTLSLQASDAAQRTPAAILQSKL
jgi:hypothetical protein